MECLNCGNEILADANFCQFCGAKIGIVKNVSFCEKCNVEYDQNAKYCPQCGNELITKGISIPANKTESYKKQCPNCNITYENDVVFCDKCGTKLQIKQLNSETYKEPIVNTSNRTEQKNDSLNSYALVTLNMMSKYKGDVNVGVAESSGKISVFNNRIEYKPQLGNAAMGAFGLAGVLVSRNNAKKIGTEVYNYINIQSVTKSKYGGVMPAILFTFKDGNQIKFSGINSNGIDDAIRVISKNIK